MTPDTPRAPECRCYTVLRTRFGQYATTEEHVTVFCRMHAAAGELLAVLEGTFPSDDPEEQMVGSDVVAQARAVIRKARAG